MEQFEIGKRARVIRNDDKRVNFIGKIGTIVNISQFGDVIGLDFGEIVKGYTWKLRYDILEQPTGRYFAKINLKPIDDYKVDLL